MTGSHNARLNNIIKFEPPPNGILVVDVDGKIILRNKRFEEIWKMPEHILETNDDKAALEFAMAQVADPLTKAIRKR